MKKLSLLSFILISILCIASGCYNNTALNTQGAINLLQNDMTNIASTIRNLDSLYLEDYAINELNPIVNYSTYNNMNYSRSVNNNVVASVSAIPYSGTYNLNYSYEPKYIDNVNSLDTTYLISYLQSMQDLFLITSDIAAANQILNQLTYDIINDTINVRNNAYLLNYNLNELSEQQIATLQEYSTTINNILANIENTSGYITNELNNLYELRNNFYKNTETLNAKYINVLNILENRITQLQNIQIVLKRLNNQLILMSDVNTFKNNNIYNSLNNNENNNNLTNNDMENNLLNNDREFINENENAVIDNNQNGINNCHQCQICDICGNCAECEICEICPNCKNQSICDGNCNIINNGENNLQNINNNSNLGNQNNLFNNNENTKYNVLNNPNTQNNLNNCENCHECNICKICNNCTNCEQCEICPQCNLPSICNGNCNNATPSQTYGSNNNLGTNVNSGLNGGNENATSPNTTTPNSANSLLNDNQMGYSNYNGSTITPILNNDENVNYKSFSIYD